MSNFAIPNLLDGRLEQLLPEVDDYSPKTFADPLP